MVHVGVSFEGKPNYPLKKLDDGFVVPDVEVADIYQYHRQQVRTQVESAVVAEKIGYDYVVHPELHFSLLGAISPNPLVTQAAIAERTDDVRLLQMANILPWHDPVRLAEQTAMVDILSDGRIEVGVGRGMAIHALEAATLGQYWGGTVQNETKNHRSFEEKFEILLDAWTEDLVSHHGEFHAIPPTYTEWDNDLEYSYLADDASEYGPGDYMSVENGTPTLESLFVSPRPEQRPHPQLWRSTSSRRSIEWAAERGINGMTTVRDFSTAKRIVDAYHETARAADWPDRRSEYDGEPLRRGWDARCRRGVVCALPVFNTDVADAETFERWKLGQEFALSSIEALRSTERADAVDVDADEMFAENDAPIVGGTEAIIDALAEFEESCGYEDFAVVLTVSVPGLSYEEKMEQVRSFVEDVVPYFEDE